LSVSACEAEQSPSSVSNRPPTSCLNPLRSLPSTLAIADVQRAVLAAGRERFHDEDGLVALLQLDPLAVVRGLRAAQAPVSRQSPTLPSVRALVKCLGPMVTRRLLIVPPVPVEADSPLRSLWHHSVATAMAA
jgi:hypothetical protein